MLGKIELGRTFYRFAPPGRALGFARQSWDDLEPAWREAFGSRGRRSGRATIPVGAVVTDAEDNLLARGRNRMFDEDAPAGQIFGSRVAHAEINALVGLGTDRRYFDCTLWTTLEPCAQCIGAAWLSTIGRVAFAATDVYGGASKLIERQIEAADSARNFHMAVEGPLTGPPAVFSELLHIAFFLERSPSHHVSETFRERRPELTALAERAAPARACGLSARGRAASDLGRALVTAATRRFNRRVISPRQVVSALGTAASNPDVRRVELAWGAAIAAEWMHFVALGVFAYEQGGTAAVGVAGLVRLLPGGDRRAVRRVARRPLQA